MNPSALARFNVRTVAHTPQSVLVAAFVRPLANTVLFSLSRADAWSGRQPGLFVVYREGDMTFEVTARLETVTASAPLEATLVDFIRSSECSRRVVIPLARTVRHHFSR